MKAVDFLAEATRLISTSREEAHGKSEKTFADIARLWNAYLDTVSRREINAADVAQMMVLLKIARAENGQFNRDDFVDEAGYAALAGALTDPANRPDEEFGAETLPPLHLKADAAKIMGAVSGRGVPPSPCPSPRERGEGTQEAAAGQARPGDKHCRAHSGDPVKQAVDDRLAKPAREDEEFRRAVRDFWRAYGVGGDQESSS